MFERSAAYSFVCKSLFYNHVPNSTQKIFMPLGLTVNTRQKYRGFVSKTNIFLMWRTSAYAFLAAKYAMKLKTKHRESECQLQMFVEQTFIIFI